MLKIFSTCILLFLLVSCKNDQMNDDPLGELLVRISGTVNPPNTWEHPRILATYATNRDKWDTGIVGTINGNTWEVFVEKNKIVSIYLFNDLNNNQAYDWPTEPRISHGNNPFTITDDDLDVGEIKILSAYGTIICSPTLRNSYPTLIDHLHVALVYADPKTSYPTIEACAKVNPDGTYIVYGGDVKVHADVPTGTHGQYRLYIFDDKDGDSYWDSQYTTDGYSSEVMEHYVQIPERGGLAFSKDQFIDLTAGSAQIDVNLCVLAGTIINTLGWTYPQAGLYQGWDITAYNEIDSNTFSFMIVDNYKINNGALQDQSYYILLFDDDNIHDGVYIYDDEKDEVNQGPSYNTEETSIVRSN